MMTVTPPSASAVVGASAGTWTVKVVDAQGDPLAGVLVRFATSLGGGRVAPVLDTTGADGTASTGLTAGTLPGSNEITASAHGLNPLKSPQIAGLPGPIRSFTFNVRSIRMSATQDSAQVTVTPRDTFGNVTTGSFTLTTTNPAFAEIRSPTSTSTWVRAVARPFDSWLTGRDGNDVPRDSIRLMILEAGSSPCAFLAKDTALAVGEMLSYGGSATVCVKTATDAQYLLVSQFNTTTAASVASTAVSGAGLGIPTPFPGVASASFARQPSAAATEPDADIAFERDLRAREREIESHLPGARAWRRALSPTQPSIVAQPRVGDRLRINVSSQFCADPAMVDARIAAISDAAIILDDVGNPAGGFSAAEYEAIARTIDTLVYPVDTAAFGAPTDIDNNGRIVVFFTKAVNALTPRASNSVVLGFFFSRDLLPRESPFGSCPGSNASEMFYVMAVDRDAVYSSERSKAYVQSVAVGTIAHELQHLINASRRIYVNGAHVANEQTWLNEGLSHVAEELAFYRASGRTPRQNLGASALADPATRAAYDLYQSANFKRYLEYLRFPEVYSPVAEQDLLQTRGASWSFLRYVADRAGTSDGDFWRRLVNSRITGVDNLEQVLAGTGMTVASALRDWGLAIAIDDLIASSSALRQASWNFLSAFSQVGLTDWIAPTSVVNGSVLQPHVRGGSAAYSRFAASAGQDALIQASGPGGVPVRGMRFTVVRIK